MTEDKPIAKPIIDDATREKMALMFSGEVYLPDDVDGFFDEIFSPQTRYFNAGLGRTEVYIW